MSASTTESITTTNGREAPKGDEPRSGVGEADPRTVRGWVEAGEAVVFDVREPDEHARERISGTRNVPLSSFDAGVIAELIRPGQRVVLHCRSGRRSADAARMCGALTEAGVAVVNMSGGIEAWKESRLPVEVDRSVSRISVMRQVQLVIGLGVLTGSALAWFVHPGFVAIPAFFGAGLTFAGASGTCALATLIGKMPWNRSGCGEAACSA